MNAQSARATRARIVQGEISAHEILDETLARLAGAEPSINAFLTVDETHARSQIDALAARLANGETPGLLWGVPFSVKDTYNTAGVRTTYGSRVFEDHLPSADAELVARVRAAGGILIGKTNTPEFAIHVRTVNDLAPETRNPWDVTRTSGGSSGGAAASIGAGVTAIAIGSDGGGSVRIPAALCGAVGLMPSRGAIPRGGGRIGTRRFSSAGPIALDALDTAALYFAMAGPSQHDGLTRGLFPTGVSGSSEVVKAPRIRWVGESGVPGVEPDVVAAAAAAVRTFAAETGGRVTESAAGMRADEFNPAFYRMMQSDRYSTGGRELLEDSRTAALLTDYARHQFQGAAKLTPDLYSAAIDVQLAAMEHLAMLLEGVDVVATPTLGFIAPSIREGEIALPEDARRGFVSFTFLMNFTGLPAITVPCGLVRGMPVGLQLIGRQGTEGMLLDLAARFQDRVFRLPSSPTAKHETVSATERTRP